MLVERVLLASAEALVLGLALLCEGLGLVEMHLCVNAGSLLGNALLQRLGDGRRLALGLCCLAWEEDGNETTAV